MRLAAAALLLAALLGAPSRPAAASWDDEGHEIIATIAAALLKPDVRRQVQAMFAADPDPLTAHDDAYGQFAGPQPPLQLSPGPDLRRHNLSDVRHQLAKAGVRLAALLNRTFEPR